MGILSTNEAISSGLTAQHIATNLQDYEAARSGFFVLKVSGLDNLLNTNYSGGIDDGDAADNMMDSGWVSDTLTLTVTKCPVPHFKVGTETIKRGNDTIYFATTPEYSGGSIEVEDFVGLDTKSILMAWQRLAYDPHTFKGGRMKDYKKTATLIEYTQDYQEIRRWTIYGIFITELSEGEFDKTADGKRNITASFVFDRAIMELPEEAEEEAA